MSVAGALAAKRDYKSMLDSLEVMKDEVMANAPTITDAIFSISLREAMTKTGRRQKL